MPVVRRWPKVSVKHQGRRLVVDATTSYDKTTTRGPEDVSSFEPVAGCFYNVFVDILVMLYSAQFDYIAS